MAPLASGELSSRALPVLFAGSSCRSYRNYRYMIKVGGSCMDEDLEHMCSRFQIKTSFGRNGWRLGHMYTKEILSTKSGQCTQRHFEPFRVCWEEWLANKRIAHIQVFASPCTVLHSHAIVAVHENGLCRVCCVLQIDVERENGDEPADLGFHWFHWFPMTFSHSQQHRSWVATQCHKPESSNPRGH
jgi:hypothetical protein